MQNADKQSASRAHVLINAQGPQVAPPQSTSVSSPDFVLSVQDGGGAAQTAAVQMPLIQSLCDRQARPVAHGEHAPPQSGAVSLPFFSPSVQLASAHDPARQ